MTLKISAFVELRPARVSDSKAIVALLRQVGYAPEAAVVARNILPLRKDRAHALRVAEVHGQVVGVVSVHLLPLLAMAEKLAFISYLAVDEGYKNYTVAHELERFVRAFAEEQGCGQIYFRCNDRKMETKRFYERLGYRGSDKWLGKKISGPHRS